MSKASESLETLENSHIFEEVDTLIAQYGPLQDIDQRIASLDRQEKAFSREISRTGRVVAQIKEDMDRNKYRRELLVRYFHKYGKNITDKNAKDYTKFKMRKWLFNAEWRRAHRAVAAYCNRGGTSIDADISNFEGQQTALNELGSLANSANKRRRSILSEKNGLEEIRQKMTTPEASDKEEPPHLFMAQKDLTDNRPTL